jgi:predicted nucleotidyltransferase component of viral defense system
MEKKVLVEPFSFSIFFLKSFSTTINIGLKEFYIEFDFEQKKHEESIDLTYLINGLLYNGQKNSLCKILLGISLRDKNILETVTKQIGLLINEIPVFDVIVLSENEIFLEKIRIIFERNKARDLYDLYYLSFKKILISNKNIEKKIGKKFVLQEFELKLDEKNRIWDTELKPIVKNYPVFENVKKQVIDFLKSIG